MAYGGLISAALGATQGAGDIATKNIDAQRDVETKATLFQRELEMKAAFEDSVARNQQMRHAAAGEAIDTEFKNQQSQQLNKDTAAINAQYSTGKDDTNLVTSEQIAALNPDQRKAYGLINASRTDDLANKADIAERLGYADHAKTFRDQQQIELGNMREANRDKNSERHMDIQEQFNKDRAVAQDRASALQEKHYRFMETNASEANKNHETQSFRAGISTLMGDNRKAITDLEKEKANASPELSKVIDAQIERFEKDNLSLNASLKDALGIKPSEKAKPSADDLAKINAVISGVQQPTTTSPGAKPVAGNPSNKMDVVPIPSTQPARYAKKLAEPFITQFRTSGGDVEAAKAALKAEAMHPGTLNSQQKARAQFLVGE